MSVWHLAGLSECVCVCVCVDGWGGGWICVYGIWKGCLHAAPACAPLNPKPHTLHSKPYNLNPTP